MKFFNKKEDVLDLELTPYGEYLLSQGDFKPTYYAFFDDEILYDGAYAGIDMEPQNDIKDRIKEVPRLKTQYMFQNTDLPTLIPLAEKEDMTPAERQAVLDALKEKNGAQDMTNLMTSPQYIKLYSLPLPIGNCSLDSEYAPAWDVKLLYNSLTGSSGVQYLTASMHPYLQIPQLEVAIKYKTSVKSLNQKPETSASNRNKKTDLRLKELDELHENPPVYSDGYYDFQEDFIMLEIEEHNVSYLKENFDIEVFEYKKDDTNRTLDDVGGDLEPLVFTKQPSNINDKGLLKSEEENIKSIQGDLETKLVPLSQKYVEHFFNIYVDYEIDKDIICKLKPAPKQKGHFVLDPLDCEDQEANIFPSDIYKGATETAPECD
tara:strand:+ start:21 stop:1148 length:1128 start_codon:yes stop_codon:yes gene_type:complete